MRASSVRPPGAALKTLFEMVKTTEVLLDLSQVSVMTDSDDLSGPMVAARAEIRFVDPFRSRVSLADRGAASPARGRP